MEVMQLIGKSVNGTQSKKQIVILGKKLFIVAGKYISYVFTAWGFLLHFKINDKDGCKDKRDMLKQWRNSLNEYCFFCCLSLILLRLDLMETDGGEPGGGEAQWNRARVDFQPS